MRLADAVRAVLSKYATFSGRAARPEFWWWVLAMLLGWVVLGALDGLIFGSDMGGGFLSGVFGLATFLPYLAVSARRLHDTDRSAWWLLLVFVPVIGQLVLIYFYVLPGTPGSNRFGPPAPPL